jgi:hypothetical protein
MSDIAIIDRDYKDVMSSWNVTSTGFIGKRTSDGGGLPLSYPIRIADLRLRKLRVINIHVIRALGGVPFLCRCDDTVLCGLIALRRRRSRDMDVTAIFRPECAAPLESFSV